MVYCKDHVLIYTMHTNQDHSLFLPPPLLSNVYPIFSVSSTPFLFTSLVQFERKES